ncbi:Hypothetical_protein [Hexamita inflata]|uniref:Hypothetical_protein n=1 Tax=Hexamita inflata TaxID=28002 RepID=A0AA86NCU0_9EUKA|nr:Hypothetical protein HINF_LOCUS4490 [Hexamita inflata]
MDDRTFKLKSTIATQYLQIKELKEEMRSILNTAPLYDPSQFVQPTESNFQKTDDSQVIKLTQDNQNLQNENAVLKKNVRKLENAQNEFQLQITNLKVELNKLKCEQIENKLDNSDLKGLQNLSQERMQQIKEELEAQANLLENQKSQLQEELCIKIENITHLEDNQTRLLLELEEARMQIQKLGEAYAKIEQDTSKEIKNLQNAVDSKNQEIQQIKLKYEENDKTQQQSIEIEQLKQQIQTYKLQMDELNQQINLQNENSLKTLQLHQQAQTDIQNLKLQIGDKNADILLMQKQNELIMQENFEQQQAKENTIIILKRKIDELQNQVEQRNKAIKELALEQLERQEEFEEQNENQENSKLMGKIDQMRIQIQFQQDKINKTEEINRKLCEQLEEFRKQQIAETTSTQNYALESPHVSNEFKYELNLMDSQQVIQNLNGRVQQLNDEIYQKSLEIQKLNERILEFESQAIKTSDDSKDVASVQRTSPEGLLQEENNQLKKEIEILNEKVKKQSQDFKALITNNPHIIPSCTSFSQLIPNPYDKQDACELPILKQSSQLVSQVSPTNEQIIEKLCQMQEKIIELDKELQVKKRQYIQLEQQNDEYQIQIYNMQVSMMRQTAPQNNGGQEHDQSKLIEALKEVKAIQEEQIQSLLCNYNDSKREVQTLQQKLQQKCVEFSDLENMIANIKQEKHDSENYEIQIDYKHKYEQCQQILEIYLGYIHAEQPQNISIIEQVTQEFYEYTRTSSNNIESVKNYFQNKQQEDLQIKQIQAIYDQHIEEINASLTQHNLEIQFLPGNHLIVVPMNTQEVELVIDETNTVVHINPSPQAEKPVLRSILVKEDSQAVEETYPDTLVETCSVPNCMVVSQVVDIDQQKDTKDTEKIDVE